MQKLMNLHRLFRGSPGSPLDSDAGQKSKPIHSLVVLSILSWRQVGNWESSRQLFSHAIEVTENNWPAWDKLGILYSSERRSRDAIRCYEAALQIRPTDLIALNNLGVAYLNSGNIPGAETLFRQLLKIPAVDGKRQIVGEGV